MTAPSCGSNRPGRRHADALAQPCACTQAAIDPRCARMHRERDRIGHDLAKNARKHSADRPPPMIAMLSGHRACPSSTSIVAMEQARARNEILVADDVDDRPLVAVLGQVASDLLRNVPGQVQQGLGLVRCSRAAPRRTGSARACRAGSARSSSTRASRIPPKSIVADSEQLDQNGGTARKRLGAELPVPADLLAEQRPLPRAPTGHIRPQRVEAFAETPFPRFQFTPVSAVPTSRRSPRNTRTLPP